VAQIVMTRREKYRAETLAEAKRIAMDQLTTDGAGAISLNGIAREMGMTGPALYRYVGNRDDLLTSLILDGYNELADALWDAVNATIGQDPADRLRAHAAAYRAWALANPQHVLLLFGTPVPGYRAPVAQTRPAAVRAMSSSFALVADLASRYQLPAGNVFDEGLESWMRSEGGNVFPGRLIRHAIVGWTRLHGVLSLELEGHFAFGLPDPALIYDSEVEALAQELIDLEQSYA
jgi:AcrR family transcriptional regulator